MGGNGNDYPGCGGETSSLVSRTGGKGGFGEGGWINGERLEEHDLRERHFWVKWLKVGSSFSCFLPKSLRGRYYSRNNLIIAGSHTCLKGKTREKHPAVLVQLCLLGIWKVKWFLYIYIHITWELSDDGGAGGYQGRKNLIALNYGDPVGPWKPLFWISLAFLTDATSPSTTTNLIDLDSWFSWFKASKKTFSAKKTATKQHFGCFVVSFWLSHQTGSTDQPSFFTNNPSIPCVRNSSCTEA